jgi:hypothetical protein
MNGATLTFDFELSGYKAALTLAGENGSDLLGKAPAVVEALGKLGASPTAQAVTQAQATSPTEKICPIHGAKMRRREKNGEVWWSHRAYREDGTEFWCRGETKAAR